MRFIMRLIIITMTVVVAGIAGVGRQHSEQSVSLRNVRVVAYPVNGLANPSSNATLPTPVQYTNAAYWIGAMNDAHSAEGIPPLSLPPNFYSDTVPEQLFILFNQERIDRGLSPYVGMTASLNAVAQQGANANADPWNWPSYMMNGGSIWSGFAWLNAAGALSTVWGWMYDDGWGGSRANTSNLACTSPTATLCWGHRDIILGTYGWESCTDCLVGAAVDSSGSYAAIFVEPQGYSPHIIYSYQQSISVPVEAAIQANNGLLYGYDWANGAWASSQGIMRGTSPAVCELATGGWEEAFQANTGNLIVVGADGNVNTGQGMMVGTNPAIACGQQGGFEVAFQANNGQLYGFSSMGGAFATGLGMMANTSPAITSIGSGYEMAFQANTNVLWLVGAVGEYDTYYGMMLGTDPAIAADGSGVTVAFQANTGVLWIIGAFGAGNTGEGMMTDTSPAITSFNGGYEVAFQANTGVLYGYSSTTGAFSTGFGMAPNTSPAIADAAPGWEMAFQANTGTLWLTGIDMFANTGLGMMAGTSPAVG